MRLTGPWTDPCVGRPDKSDPGHEECWLSICNDRDLPAVLYYVIRSFNNSSHNPYQNYSLRRLRKCLTFKSIVRVLLNYIHIVYFFSCIIDQNVNVPNTTCILLHESSYTSCVGKSFGPTRNSSWPRIEFRTHPDILFLSWIWLCCRVFFL